MWVRINGDWHEVTTGSTVQDVVDERNKFPSGVAVALDGEVVPRTAWAETPIPPDAAVEIVTAMQGG